MHNELRWTRALGLRRKLTTAAKILLLVLVVAAAASALWNRFAARASSIVEVLDPRQKALLGEVMRLKKSVGDTLWPGFGQAEIPLLAYNERYSFLVGSTTRPAGWDPVAAHDFFGQPYYRGQMERNQAFTVKLGQRWVASMATREWMRISLGQQIREQLPGLLKPVFPYPLAIRVLGGHSSEKYISAVLHESFHAYQAETAPARFARAMQSYSFQSSYPLGREEMRRGWSAELKLLARALNAKSDQEAADLTRQFIAQRRQRRERLALSSDLIDYERQMEWLEGLAKYIELGSWREASVAQQKGYLPMAELISDPEFEHYSTFSRRWKGEVSTLKWQSSQRGDGRFYYSGMAQAFLLDRLAPGWKLQVSLEAVDMDQLLEQRAGSLLKRQSLVRRLAMGHKRMAARDTDPPRAVA